MMSEKACNRDLVKKPIENQGTAAWADVGKTKRVSHVHQPDIEQTHSAKEYVDENEK